MRLVESILNLSRIDADQLQLQRTTTDLNSLVKHSLTASIVQLAEAQNVSLSYQFAGQALPIAVDADRIGQAITTWSSMPCITRCLAAPP
jgi:signal transduction histidine kinase